MQELSNCQTVILSVEDEMGQRIIIEDLLEATRGADAGLREASVTILNAYFSRTRLDYSTHTRTLLSGLVRLLNDPNPEVLHQSWDTISSITKVQIKYSQGSFIMSFYNNQLLYPCLLKCFLKTEICEIRTFCLTSYFKGFSLKFVSKKRTLLVLSISGHLTWNVFGKNPEIPT